MSAAAARPPHRQATEPDLNQHQEHVPHVSDAMIDTKFVYVRLLAVSPGGKPDSVRLRDGCYSTQPFPRRADLPMSGCSVV